MAQETKAMQDWRVCLSLSGNEKCLMSSRTGRHLCLRDLSISHNMTATPLTTMTRDEKVAQIERLLAELKVASAQRFKPFVTNRHAE
jgi:hypothetical protein